MTVTAVSDEPFSLVKRIVNVFCLVHSKYGGELFVSELFRKFNALNFTDKNLCALGNLNACESGDCNRLLTNYLSVKRTVDYDGLTNLLGLLGI